MGIGAITRRNNGSEVRVPTSSEDWNHWVSAGRTRNWVLDDPLIDWLQMYGKDHGFVPERDLRGYISELNFLDFIFDKGRGFEAGILRLLQERYAVTTIAGDFREIRKLERAHETFVAMLQEAPIIYQAVLWDAEYLTYGSPDFLIRSDVLIELFPNSISSPEAVLPAPDLGGSTHHYRIVDTKFTTLKFNAAGTELANNGSTPAYKAQLFVYNRMLGRLQGYEPPESYLLGRGWDRTQKGEIYRGTNALELLGPVRQDGTLANGVLIADAVENALNWVRRVRSQGKDWQLIPEPSVPELYPNMSGGDDDMMTEIDPENLEEEDDVGHAGDWQNAKKWLAQQLGELTQLWQVGTKGRKESHLNGIYRMDDPKLSPELVGVTGTKRGPTLRQLLDVNRDDGPLVLPSHIRSDRAAWNSVPGLEFYVDFEFCSDLNDDFSLLPEKGGQPLIFMIGCGHLEDGKWQFNSFIANELSEQEEFNIISQWFNHMETVRERLDPANTSPQVIHWSHAEVSVFQTAYNSARVRHGEPAEWPEPAWYDFLSNVFREEPVVVKGAFAFGLKAIAKAMYANGLIETDWADSPIDGLGAMVGAWHCDDEARRLSVPMGTLPLMQDIASYNEIDCKVMMEIVRYLRKNH